MNFSFAEVVTRPLSVFASQLPGRASVNRFKEAIDAGWSSPVARQAHNLKVAGSNPAPATKYNRQPTKAGGFFMRSSLRKTQAHGV